MGGSAQVTRMGSMTEADTAPTVAVAIVTSRLGMLAGPDVEARRCACRQALRFPTFDSGIYPHKKDSGPFCKHSAWVGDHAGWSAWQARGRSLDHGYRDGRYRYRH